MNNKGFAQELSDLMLRKEWIKNRTLRSSYHGFFICLILMLIINLIVALSPLAEVLPKMSNGSSGFRIVMFAICLVSLVALFRLTFYYFKHTIEQGHPITLENIFVFYLFMVLLFGLLYYYAFFINPNLFQFNSLYVHWTPLIGLRTYEGWSTKISFLLYSTFESIGGNSTYIESNSILVSILNYAQTLYCFCLVSLLIAGYINQRTNKPA